MLVKSISLFALAGTTLAVPQLPNVSDIAASLSSKFAGAIPTNINDITSGLTLPAGVSSNIAVATGLLNALSDLPTLPASVVSVLETAVPTSDIAANPCALTTASWYRNLPTDVKSALSSYGTAVASWASAHSSVLGTYTYTGPSVPVCTTAHGGSGSGSGSQTTSTKTGTATGAAGGASASGASVTTTRSAGAAPRATAIMGSAAGILGALGVMIAL